MLSQSNVKLERPVKFDSVYHKFQNFLFEVQQFGLLAGLADEETVKLAVTLLSGKAMMWWRTVASENWAQLGSCNWQTFSQQLSAAFQDPNHVMWLCQQLSSLRQKTSVQTYNAAFRNAMLELSGIMSTHDVLFTYLSGLKPQIHQQGMMHQLMDVATAMQLADHADSAMWMYRKYDSNHSRALRHPQPNLRPTPPSHVPMDLGFLSKERKPIQCYNCGEYGHMKTDCQKGRSQKGGVGRKAQGRMYSATGTEGPQVVTMVPLPQYPMAKKRGVSILPNQNQFADLEWDVMLGSINVDAGTASMNVDVQTFTQVFDSRSVASNHSVRGLGS